jgi:hypothetical protein
MALMENVPADVESSPTRIFGLGDFKDWGIGPAAARDRAVWCSRATGVQVEFEQLITVESDKASMEIPSTRMPVS